MHATETIYNAAAKDWRAALAIDLAPRITALLVEGFSYGQIYDFFTEAGVKMHWKRMSFVSLCSKHRERLELALRLSKKEIVWVSGVFGVSGARKS